MLFLVRLPIEILEKKFRPEKPDELGTIGSRVLNVLGGTGIAAYSHWISVFRDRTFFAFLQRPVEFGAFELLAGDQIR